MLPQLQRCLDPLGSHQPTKNQRTKSFPTTVLGITESREGVGPREPVKNHQRHRCSLTLIRLSEQRWVADADRETNSGWAVGDGIYRILWRVIDVRLILSSVI